MRLLGKQMKLHKSKNELAGDIGQFVFYPSN